MYTTHHPAWDAKNRHNLPEELPLDFDAIAHVLPSKWVVREEQAVEPEPVAEPVLELVAEAPQENKTVVEQEQLKKDEPPTSKLPKALLDLMETHNVQEWQIQDVVAQRGYYPKGTPIENYDPEFIEGVLIAAWDQMYEMIILSDSIPF
jgi:hypothetical protein